MKKSFLYLVGSTVLVSVAVLVSGLAPFDRATWWMETAPVFVVYPVLWFALLRRRFALTHFLYGLIALHALVLIVGGAYSYARVPLGSWMQDFWQLSRNPYDKIGHFMQGFVPALVARELMVRLRWVNSFRVAGFLSICVAMAMSALYELIEWFAAQMLGQGADEFLGTQGYVWDTQSDILFALIGASVAVLLLGRIQARAIAKIGREQYGQ